MGYSSYVPLARMDLKTKVNPLHTALLIIDVQRDHAAPDGVLAGLGRDVSLAEQMIDTLERLLPVAEKAKVATFYTRQVYDPARLTSLQREQFELDGHFITCNIATSGHEFYRIKPPQECVFEKCAHNALANKELEKTLQERGIKTLVITGMDTIWCVESTIRYAFDQGYKIVVPEDCVAGNARHMDLHEKTLELVRRTFGVVTTAAELVKIWESR